MGNGIDCTCGSGAHPRKCVKHPELYRLHVAELNLEGYLPEGDKEAFEAMDELLAAFREALKAAREHPKLQCAYANLPLDPSDPEDKYWRCEAEADFTCCDFGGPVCAEHKCRCSKPLTHSEAP